MRHANSKWNGFCHWWLQYDAGSFDALDRLNTSPIVSVAHWYSIAFPAFKSKPLECVQHGGDVIFIPAGWIHSTLNIGETIGVGGQIEWTPQARDQYGRLALKRNPDDFQGNRLPHYHTYRLG